MDNYELWDQHKFLGMIAEVVKRDSYFLNLMFGYEIRSDDEFIDFEKIPAIGRVVAPYVMPMAEGRPVFELSSRVGRFKPAYSKVKDVIDPRMGLRKVAGSGEAMFNPASLTIMERRELIRAMMNQQHIESLETLWELQAAHAVIFGAHTVSGVDYPTQLLNFGRAANLTVVKGAGQYWGDAGVSIWADIQAGVDAMTDAEFGAMPTRLTMSRAVWSIVQKDVEILKHMDTNIAGGAATIFRGITAAAPDDAKSYKVGELRVGGASGAVIELWVNYEKYQPTRGAAEVLFLPSNMVVLSGSKTAYQGHRCFGAIIDPKHEYAAMPISGRNWSEDGDPAVEYMLHQSSPIHVPVNPNATMSLKVLA